MNNTQWIQTSDEQARDTGRDDGRADCVTWLAARLDESERMIARDNHSEYSLPLEDEHNAPAPERSARVVAGRVIVAALLAASALIVHLILG